jgi:hypothetical protein
VQTVLSVRAHITLKVLNKGSPPKGISYVTDLIICVSTKVLLFESAPDPTTALSHRSKISASRLLHPNTPGNPPILAYRKTAQAPRHHTQHPHLSAVNF